MNKIFCRTLFDITRTNVKHTFNAGKLPFRDANGRIVADHRTWMLARNQQRNWETLIQLISLRCQPHDLSSPDLPTKDSPWWRFQFSVEDTNSLALDGREFALLEQDCAMVPMLIGLSEQIQVTPMLIPGINLIFERPTHK